MSWMSDTTLLKVARDIGRGFSRRKYEEFLVELRLYSLKELRGEDEPLSRMTKNDLILETLQSHELPILEALHERYLLEKDSLYALAMEGFGLENSMTNDPVEPILDPPPLEMESAKRQVDRIGQYRPEKRSMDYLDFELEIGEGKGREYSVAVLRSPAGEAQETMRFPFDELALESKLKDLQIALLRSGGKRRRMPSPEEQTVQDFGRALFDALLTGEMRDCYDKSRREAAKQGKGLRLKLRIRPPELAALPWEFLYDSDQREYVCLSRDTPVVRYLEPLQFVQPFAVTPPLHVLGMVASPIDLESLDVEREKQRVEEALKDLQAAGLVELTWLPGQTWRHLQRAMRRSLWHVFHFIGHGGFDRVADEGYVVLADEYGDSWRLMATQLARLLADHRSLRLALLNSCEGARGGTRDIFSSAAFILVQRGIPGVVAMQYEITDRAAIELSRTFYEALADGLPVDAAVTEARKALSLAVTNTVEWGTPVLYMSVSDGVLFNRVYSE